MNLPNGTKPGDRARDTGLAVIFIVWLDQLYNTIFDSVVLSKKDRKSVASLKEWWQVLER